MHRADPAEPTAAEDLTVSRFLPRARRLIAATRRRYRGWRGALLVLIALAVIGLANTVTDDSTDTLLIGGLILGAMAAVALIGSLGGGGGPESPRPGAAPVHARPRQEPSPLASGAPVPEPRVAIVVTAHNESSLLADCLRSLLRQTTDAWECVVMDDKSTDDTLDVARSVAGNDPRFRIYANDRNVGQGPQRNAGVSLTSAPFVAFLDGDDFLFAEAIASRLAALESSDHGALGGIFCNWVEVGHSAEADVLTPSRRRRPRVTWFKGMSTEGVPFISTAPMLRRSAFVAVGGFRPLRVAQDVDLWQRLLRRGFFFDSVKEVGVAYRQRTVSTVHRSSLDSARSIAGMVADAASPLAPGEGVGPFVFREPFHVYPPRLMFVRRMVRAMAFDLAAGRDPSAALDQVTAEFEPHMEWTLDLESLIASVSRLATLASAQPAPANHEAMTSALAPLIARSREIAEQWQAAEPEMAMDVGATERGIADSR